MDKEFTLIIIMLGKGSRILETHHLWRSRNFVWKTISLNFAIRGRVQLLHVRQMIKNVYFELIILQVKITVTRRVLYNRFNAILSSFRQDGRPIFYTVRA